MTDTNTDQKVQEEKTNTETPVVAAEAASADEKAVASNCSPAQAVEEKKAV